MTDVPIIPKERAGMTVGSLKFLLQGLDDMVPVCVAWEPGREPASDSDPAVRVFGFQKERYPTCITIRVGLEWLDEEETCD